MDPPELAKALEAAHEAAAEVLNDAFEGQDIEIATMALHVAVRPVEERREPGGWSVFVFSWMTQPEVIDALEDGRDVRTALSEVLAHNAQQMAPPPPPAPRRPIKKPQAPI